MFGITMKIAHGETKITLRALKREDIAELVEHFSSMKIHMYTKGIFAQTLENEYEWYEERRKSQDDVTWAIVPDGQEKPIGVTSLHNINNRYNSATSGIIIWNSNWWGKRIASSAHLGRTMFAADYLNRWTIKSSVRVPNDASRKALEGVGYAIWGKEPCSIPRASDWLETYQLKWFHPERTGLLFPQGTPEEYRVAVEKASKALETARRVVSFI